MKDALEDFCAGYVRSSIAVKEALLSQQLSSIVALGEGIADCFAAGGKLLIFGNGGSAADSQHMATELVVRLSADFEREALPALALTTDSSLLTACSNDYSFARIFARQIEAFGKPGDMTLGISTSGNSSNVIEAFETARERGLKCGLLSGESGGKLKNLADYAVLVPSTVTSHIQECHITVVHMLCEIVERKNYKKCS